MLVLMKRVNDLNRLIEMLRGLGLEIREGTHAVLTDGSEIGVWCGSKEGKDVVCMVVHYIDSHYDALIKLPPDADDATILRALIEAERGYIWRVPVEPVLFVFFEIDDVLRNVMNYDDEMPSEAREAFETYTRSMDAVMRTYVENLRRVFRMVSDAVRDLRLRESYERAR